MPRIVGLLPKKITQFPMKLNNAIIISKVVKGFNMNMKYKRLLHETFILVRTWLIKLNPVVSLCVHLKQLKN